MREDRLMANDMKKGQWNWRGADWVKMKRETRKLVEEVRWETLTLEEAAGRLQGIVLVACERSVEKVEKRVKQVRWWSEELGNMRREVKRKRRRWIRYREREDRRIFVLAAVRYKLKIQERRREVWEWELTRMNEEDLFGDAYKVLRGKRSREVVLSTLKKEDGGWTSGVEDTMKYILDELLPVDNEGEDTEEQVQIREVVRRRELMDDGEILEMEGLEREVERAVRKFKNKKAPGEDGIKAEVLKSLCGEIKKVVAGVLIQMKAEGVFPKIWKTGIVKLIKKGEDKPVGEVKSYRPVTLLPVLGKLVERVVAGWLMSEIEDKLNDRQYGFRRGVGTKDALLKFKNSVHGMREKYVYGVFADIKGAFDQCMARGHSSPACAVEVLACHSRHHRRLPKGKSGEVKSGGVRDGEGSHKGLSSGLHSRAYPMEHSVQQVVRSRYGRL